MSFYTAIDRRINADEWFRGLTIEHQWLWLRLLTGAHVTAVAGLWPATEDGLARNLRISTKKFLALFSAFEGRAFADWNAGVIYLPNALKIEPNQPRNEATLKGWIKPLELVPECRLRDRALAEFITWILSEPKRFPNGVPDGFPRSKAPPSSPTNPPPAAPGNGPTVSVTVTETVSPTVTETVSPTVTETVTETVPSRARVQPRAHPNSDHETETDHEPTRTVSGRSSDTNRIRCPVPIPVPEDSLTSLEISIGIPQTVARKSILDFSLAWNAKLTDLRSQSAWIGSVVKALTGDWSDPAKRARMRAAGEDRDPDEATRQADAAARRARHEERIRRKTAEADAALARGGAVPVTRDPAKLIEGIGS